MGIISDEVIPFFMPFYQANSNYRAWSSKDISGTTGI